MLAALGSDGLFENVPIFLLLPALPPVRSQKLNLETTIHHSLRKFACHCQRTGKPLILKEMLPYAWIRAGFHCPVAATRFPENEHTRSFVKRFNKSSKYPKRRLASNVRCVLMSLPVACK